MLRRLQFRAQYATQRDLRRAALWSAALVLGVSMVTWIISHFASHYFGCDPPVWLDSSIFFISLPLVAGDLLVGSLARLFPYLLEIHPTMVDWVRMGVGIAINWYLYFLIFSFWLHYRNKKKQQRAAGVIN
jgi:hypothetical protein